MPVILAFKRPRQEDCMFETGLHSYFQAVLNYIDPVSKQQLLWMIFTSSHTWSG